MAARGQLWRDNDLGRLMYLRNRLRNYDGTYQYGAGDVNKLLCRGDMPGHLWARNSTWQGGNLNSELVGLTERRRTVDSVEGRADNPANLTDAQWRTRSIAEIRATADKLGIYAGLFNYAESYYNVFPSTTPPSVAGFMRPTHLSVTAGDRALTRMFEGYPVDRVGFEVVEYTPGVGDITASATNPMSVALVEYEDEDDFAYTFPELEALSLGVFKEGAHEVDVSSLGLSLTIGKTIALVGWLDAVLPEDEGTPWKSYLQDMDIRLMIDDPP